MNQRQERGEFQIMEVFVIVMLLIGVAVAMSWVSDENRYCHNLFEPDAGDLLP